MPPTAVFHELFVLLPSTAVTFSKKTRPTKNLKKNLCFYRFFAYPRLRARFENHWIITSNTLLERVTLQKILGRHFFRVSGRQNCPGGISGSPWKGSCGFSGTLLAANFALLAHSWPLLAALGSLLGCSWDALGTLLDALGRSWTLLGRSWTLLGRSRLDLRPSKGRF